MFLLVSERFVTLIPADRPAFKASEDALSGGCSPVPKHRSEED